jgi:tetratricopeptide (TPR) repeat protein
MRLKTLLCAGGLALLFAGCVGEALGQQTGTAASPLDVQRGPNPLAVGLAALEHGDYGAAMAFFSEYLSSSPNDLEARLDLGSAELGLKEFAAAVKEFHAVIAVEPDLWPAHLNLVLAYAELQDWSDFDQERALIKAARDKGAPGLDEQKGDLIDVLHVGPKTYSVRAFYELYGRYHTRYVFLHFAEDGKLTDYVQCESDDADQGFFKQAHPKEAAVGARSFSLDTYTIDDKGMSQGLIKFYSDGEPTYETVRADVLKVLTSKEKPAASASPDRK